MITLREFPARLTAKAKMAAAATAKVLLESDTICDLAVLVNEHIANWRRQC